jgi:DNA polymerase III alpha subunit (gram-positive type)
MWQIAETILFTEKRYGQTYTQAAEATGLSEETLRNYVSTAHRVPRERRRKELHFSHHQEVASLEPEAQDEWLDKAVVNNWNRAELRAQLNPIKGNIVTPALHSAEEIEYAARDLVRSAKQYGKDFLVQRPSFVQLCAALGEEL